MVEVTLLLLLEVAETDPLLEIVAVLEGVGDTLGLSDILRFLALFVLVTTFILLPK